MHFWPKNRSVIELLKKDRHKNNRRWIDEKRSNVDQVSSIPFQEKNCSNLFWHKQKTDQNFSSYFLSNQFLFRVELASVCSLSCAYRRIPNNYYFCSHNMVLWEEFIVTNYNLRRYLRHGKFWSPKESKACPLTKRRAGSSSSAMSTGNGSKALESMSSVLPSHLEGPTTVLIFMTQGKIYKFTEER